MSYLHAAIRLTAIVFLLLISGIIGWDTFVCMRNQTNSTISEAIRIWNEWSGGLVQWLSLGIFCGLWLHIFVGTCQRAIK